MLPLFRERFNDLQSKLHELDVIQQSSDEFFRTSSPSSRDSGIPARSSSSCCSLTSESASTPKSSIDIGRSSSPQTSVLQFFLHPPDDHHRHVTVCLNESTSQMSSITDSIPSRYQSHGRNVHWNEKKNHQAIISSTHPRRSSSYHTFQRDFSNNNCYSSDTSIMKAQPQRISLNASLPFQAKLNIHIHADRSKTQTNDPNRVKATASIENLTDPTGRSHLTLPKNEDFTNLRNKNIINKTERTSSMYARESRRDKLPRHRQVSLPMSLPIDQRLYLYIRNGEVLARC